MTKQMKTAVGMALAVEVALLPLLVTRAQAPTLSVLYTFSGGADGASPNAGLIPDTAGNFYGTTAYGGVNGAGTVFKLDSAGNETVLYSFTGGSDGSIPVSALVPDAAGDLYGTTYRGGSFGSGVVFKLDAAGNETVLHNFTGGTDGANPDYGGLLRDRAGNLYGVTALGGNTTNVCGGTGCGVVFRLDQTGNETVLYTFTGGLDGGEPLGALTRDTAGNLYGTTYWGGADGDGVVFKLNPAAHETVLHSFAGTDGEHPFAGVTRDLAGNLYGTTAYGGTYGYGEIFELDSAGTETVLYSFTGGLDGNEPIAGLIRDARGNLYGTTIYGGVYGYGTGFKLSPAEHETVLYSFTGGTDGAYPDGALFPYKGFVYGTTTAGGIAFGSAGSGVVFKLSLH